MPQSVYCAPCGTAIGADVVADNIYYTTLDIRLEDICYCGRANRIAANNLGVDQSCSMLFIHLDQYLKSFQNRLTGFPVADSFLKGSPFIIIKINNGGLAIANISVFRSMT